MFRNNEAAARATGNGTPVSSDKESQFASRFDDYAIAIFVGVLYLPVSIFFMMWWGYGGYDQVAPSWMRGLPAQVPAYVAISVAVVHLPLFPAGRLVRTAAVLFWIAPWAVVVFASVAGASGGTLLWAVVVPAVCYYSHTFLESLRN